jgi:hypothetical protein
MPTNTKRNLRIVWLTVKRENSDILRLDAALDVKRIVRVITRIADTQTVRFTLVARYVPWYL